MTAAADQWKRIGRRVGLFRNPAYNLNSIAVSGEGGLLIVDTPATKDDAELLRHRMTTQGYGSARWIVNTHVHFDHTFGNATFARNGQLYVPEIWAHQNTTNRFGRYAEEIYGQFLSEGPVGVAQMSGQTFAEPTHSISSRASINMGDHQVELLHLGRGHTDGDLIVMVTDENVAIVGDLVKESGFPSHWEDSFPLDWPDTLQSLVELIDEDTVVIPGHGKPVDREFVAAQSADQRTIANEIMRLHELGEPVAAAVAKGRWPYRSPRIATAVERGYWQLDAHE